MVSEAVQAGHTRRLDIPFILVCVVALAASITAYMQYQRVTQLTAALAQASAQMQQQATQLRTEEKPDIPVSVGFRAAMLGVGLVMEVRNNSATELELAAAFSSNSTGQIQQRNLVLPSNRMLTFGSTEGWAFEPGQRVVLSNGNYRTAEFTVPSLKH